MDTEKVTPQQILDRARLCLGVPFRFGAEADVSKQPAELDCSELVEWVCRGLGLTMPDGSGNQMAYCTRHGLTTTLDAAFMTPAALVFRRNKASLRIEHVGITDGRGNTIEARGSKYNKVGHGTWTYPRRSNWTDAALIPGVDYT